MLIYTTDIIRGTQAGFGSLRAGALKSRLSIRNIAFFSRLVVLNASEVIRLKQRSPYSICTDLVNESASFIPPGIERVFSGFFCVCFCRELR